MDFGALFLCELTINELFIGPAGLKVVLDFCGLNLLGPQDAEGTSNLSATVHIKK